jgi:hypothetical protein
MKKEIAFIMPYFGTFRPSLELWIESVRNNPQIDWIIFTDNKEPSNLPQNIIWKETTLKDVENLATKKMGQPVNLSKPYKLCDLKTFYGIVFEDFLTDYNYYGYGDFDVVYGRLYQVLKDINYTDYDKINRWGHCTLVKNTEDMKNLLLDDEIQEKFNIKKILSEGRNFGFDELDYNTICWENGKKMYVGPFSADIDIFYERMRCVDKKTMTKICKVSNVTYAPKNYRRQVFVYADGKALRLFIKGKKVCNEEFAYIHYRREGVISKSKECKDFVISREGFFDLDINKIDNLQYVENLIEKYNSNQRYITERLQYTPLWKPLSYIYKKIKHLD